MDHDKSGEVTIDETTPATCLFDFMPVLEGNFTTHLPAAERRGVHEYSKEGSV